MLIENPNIIMYLKPSDIIVREGLERYRKDLGELAKLQESITTFGQLQPILITDQYELVAGGRRLAACTELGIRVKAVYQENVSDSMLREMELEENVQRKALTPAQEVTAIAEIYRLKQERHGIAVPGKKDAGFTQAQMGALIGKTQPAVVEALALAALVEQFPSLSDCKTKKEIKKSAEILTKTMTRMANLSAHEDIVKDSGYPITLHFGDALEHMKSIPDNSVDLLLTDPPFGIDIDKNAIGMGGQTGGDSTAGFSFEDGKEGAIEILSYLAMESYRFCSSSAHGYVFVAPEHYSLVREMFIAVGWIASFRLIVWVKRETGQNNAPQCWPSAAYEFILFVREKVDSKLLQQGKADWIQCDPVLPSVKIHPTEKPVLLLENLISRTTDIGQTLYDPFCGSGSSLEAGLNMQLKVIGCEILKDAYASAQTRIAKWAEKQARMKEAAGI